MNTKLKCFSITCMIFAIGVIFYASATPNDNIFINQRTGEVLTRNQFQDLVNMFAYPIIILSSISFTLLLLNDKRAQQTFQKVEKDWLSIII